MQTSDLGADMDVLRTGPGRGPALQLLGLNFIARVLRHFAFRGWTHASELLGRFFPERNHALVSFGGDARLKVYLGDYYWARYAINGGAPYEPELEFVLEHALDKDSVFLDCGANIGHWSAFASQIISRSDHILAIEADPHAFALLAAGDQTTTRTPEPRQPPFGNLLRRHARDGDRGRVVRLPAENRLQDESMSGIREQEQSRYLGQRDRQVDWPPNHAHERVVSGRLLLGVLVLCLDLWLLGVLAMRWLS